MNRASTFRASSAFASKTTCTSLKMARNYLPRRVPRWKIRLARDKPARCHLCFWNGGAAVEAEQIGVSHVSQIFDSNLAGEKAVCGHLTKKCKELYALAQAVICLRVLTIGDQIENFLLLRRGALEIGFFVAIRTSRVHPHQPAAKLQLKLRVFARE